MSGGTGTFVCLGEHLCLHVRAGLIKCFDDGCKDVESPQSLFATVRAPAPALPRRQGRGEPGVFDAGRGRSPTV